MASDVPANPSTLGHGCPKWAKVAKIGCKTVVGEVPRLAQDLTGISPNPKQGVFSQIFEVARTSQKQAFMSYFGLEHDWFARAVPICPAPLQIIYCL